MSNVAELSDYVRLGEAKIREVLQHFLSRVFEDFMIGYLFRGKSFARIYEMEVRFAIEHLGGPFTYKGRGMQETHAPLQIFSGQFDRRRQLLKQSLSACEIPPDIAERWIAYQEGLRSQIIVKAC